MIGMKSGIMYVLLDQLILDIAKLIIRSVPVQDLAIKNIYPTGPFSIAIGLGRSGGIHSLWVKGLSLARLDPDSLLIRPSLMSLLIGLIGYLFIVLFARFWRCKDWRSIRPCDRDVKVRSLVSVMGQRRTELR